ncbi:hypothetical protein F4861DRAFT_12397 [Xylaria intraflava]|nr:hypothetical protein F4861DRAFT_12397 [Xylaria intraflava]
MLQASRQSYVCWQCSALRSGSGPFSRLHRPFVTRIPRRATQYTNPASRRDLATVQNPSYFDGSYTDKKRPPRMTSIRRRLQEWENENPAEAPEILVDSPPEGDPNNAITRPQNVTMIQIELGDSSPLFARDELAELRSDDAMLDAGDLVELSSTTSRRPILAICLGYVNGYQYFYTVSGKWFTAIAVQTLFVVSKFATQEEMNPIISALPSGNASFELLHKLQELGEGPTRSAGAPLLHKMLQFAQDAETVYQANSDRLDASSSLVCDPLQHQYLTLHQIADRLIEGGRDEEDRFSTHSLYAVHRALLQDEVIFRPLRQVGHNRSYLFEVSPLSEISLVYEIEGQVRDYLESRGNIKPSKTNGRSSIETFARKAQKVIDESRKNRAWSHGGVVGPSSNPTQVDPNWSHMDRKILHFVELWASYKKFPPHSRMQVIGSSLLRALDRYKEAEGYLPVTGWTFLQEVGWIPPWEIPARYSVRLPGVDIKRGGGYTRPITGMLDAHLKRDMLSLIRRPLAGVTAYCVDDITAREIDDAVSLERTSNSEEYWIHVHVADPASSIAPNTPVAKYAELIPEAIYLPGHMESMLPEEFIHDRFSLAPGRPCLTFSALVNTNGDVLDEKITANSLDKVVYMTYEDAALAIGETPEEPYAGGAQWGIGNMPKAQPPNRKMTRSEDLIETEKSDLTILSDLGKKIQARRLDKGATPFFQPRPTATIDFDGVKQEESNGFISTSGDPLIHVHYSSNSNTDLVANAMKLANEVAARWCHKRGVPIPYRTQPHASRNEPLVRQYMRDVLNPLLNSGAPIDETLWRRMRSMIGLDEVSTTPKPHFTLGVDMYTKATSPLRRYSDLIVHWQIEAALLEEAKQKREIVRGQNDDLSFLPFSRDRLDRMLPMLRLREKQARILTNVDGADQWILIAMARAWRFKEAELPEIFRMTVDHKSQARIFGRINWFDRRVTLDHEGLNDIILSADVRIGDVFDVRITNINVYSKHIFVELLNVVKKAEDNTQDTESLQVPLDGAKINDISDRAV